MKVYNSFNLTSNEDSQTVINAISEKMETDSVSLVVDTVNQTLNVVQKSDEGVVTTTKLNLGDKLPDGNITKENLDSAVTELGYTKTTPEGDVIKLPEGTITETNLDEKVSAAGYIKENALDDYAKAETLDTYATKTDIEGFVKQESLNDLVTQDGLLNYATKSELTGYATKESIEGFVKAENLDEKIQTIAAEEIAKVVDNAPEEFDTLKEIGTWINGEGKKATQVVNKVTELDTAVNELKEKIPEEGLSTTKTYDKFVVVGIWGQSNAVGYDESLLTPYDIPIEPARIKEVVYQTKEIAELNYCAHNDQDMRNVGFSRNGPNPTERVEAGETGDRLSAPTTKGIHLPLANLIASVIPEDYGVIIVPAAYGGKSISYFNASKQKDFADRIKVALEGEKNILAGILWCQGEQDSNTMNKDTYKSNFENLISGLASQLTDVAKKSFNGKVDKSIWFNFEYPLDYKNTTYGRAILEAQKDVLGEDHYTAIPDQHPVNTMNYTSGNNNAHYGQNYYRTHIAPRVFETMKNAGVFLTGGYEKEATIKETAPSETPEVQSTFNVSIPNDGEIVELVSRIPGDSDINFPVGKSKNKEQIVEDAADGNIQLQKNMGMLEFPNAKSMKFTSSSDGIMVYIGKTSDGKTLELYLGSNNAYKPLFQRANTVTDQWTNVLDLVSGVSSSGGQITFNDINSWCKFNSNGVEIKVEKIDNTTLKVYKNDSLVGTVDLKLICADLVATLGFGSYWTGSYIMANNVSVVPETIEYSASEMINVLMTKVKALEAKSA